MIDSLINYHQTTTTTSIMNNNTNADNGGWENILLTNYFDGGANGVGVGGVGGGGDTTGTAGLGNDGSGAPSASAAGGYDSTGYAAYLQANYQLKGNSDGGGGGDSSSNNNAANNGNNLYSYAPSATTGLNYGGSSGGYSMIMPSQQSQAGGGRGYNPSSYQTTQGGTTSTRGSFNDNQSLIYGATSPQPTVMGQQQQQQQPLFGLQDTNTATTGGALQRRSMSDESQTNNAAAASGVGGVSNDPYGVDYNNYGNYYANNSTGGQSAYGGTAPTTTTAAAPQATTFGGMNDASNNYGTATNYGNTTNTNNSNVATNATNNLGASELDYCDALLRGMDDPSFGWLAGAFGAAAANNNNNSTSRQSGSGRNNGYGNYHHAGGGGSNQLGGMAAAGGLGGYGDVMGGEQLALPTGQQQQQQQQGGMGGGNKAAAGGSTTLDAFFAAQHHQQQQQQQVQQVQAMKQLYQPQTKKAASRSSTRSTTTATRQSRSRTTSSRSRKTSSAAAATTTTLSSTRLSPNQTDGHSSLPSHQIDPLLDTISLTVTAVSLQPLSGNEVVRHVRTKTDDVITRFLPCVDFLVNCQQELRQGLQMAQRPRSRSVHGRNRHGGGMTSRQFHASYVAPLPRRFERHNESIMAREHLRQAKTQLELLVRDAQNAVPQGCDHVKNAFLGGMRENESWGLRKWLSKHGGAGSICNDLEEVMRNVKALKKEEETTRRLAGMLRPIAKQAFERLKKDVPQAYQEQSSAHPYLPFFHRLEACLKQMANYDPEEDDVICLSDSDDEEEEEDVKVVASKSNSVLKGGNSNNSAHVANPANSSAIKKRMPASRPSPAKPKKQLPMRKSPKRRSNEDVAMTMTMEGGNDAKRSRANTEENFVDAIFGKEGSSGNGNGVKEEKKVAATKANKEPEVICLDDSDEEEEDETVNATAAAAAVGVKNDESDAAFFEALGSSMSPAATTNQDYRLVSGDTPVDNAHLHHQHHHAHHDHHGSDAATAAALAVVALCGGASSTGAGAGSATQGGGNNMSTTMTDGVQGQWRCEQCTFLNEAFASKCVMCNDEDSADGGNTSDDLANFLGGSSFLEGSSNHSFSASDVSRNNNYERRESGGGQQQQQQQQGRALQSADARELECLAEHIANGGSLPKQAHRNVDAFWASTDMFPQILMLFRTILQHPASHRFLEPQNEGYLFMMGLPTYGSIVNFPELCFHEIVSALSKSEDALKYPHLTMRLSNGQINHDGLRHWNMWNGKELIEAIDLVLLNSLAYNSSCEQQQQQQSREQSLQQQQQLLIDTESLRDVLWEGVNGMLKRLQPHERREHLPQKRSPNSGFVILGKDHHGYNDGIGGGIGR